jgi:hypothetical protein
MLVVYSSPNRLVLCFCRNVSVTDALSLWSLAGFVCNLHFWSGHYPGLCCLQCHLLFLATALYVHRALNSRSAVYYVALTWLLMSAFSPKTLMHLKSPFLTSRKSCRFVPMAENDLSWLQLRPPPTELSSAQMPYLHSEYSVLHVSLFRLTQQSW